MVPSKAGFDGIRQKGGPAQSRNRKDHLGGDASLTNDEFCNFL
jgi:hypothetical protein